MSCAGLIVLFITVPLVFLIGLTALLGVEQGSMAPDNIALAIIVPFGLIVFFAFVILGIASASDKSAEANFKELLRNNRVREGSLEWNIMVEDYEQKHQQ